MANFQKVYIGKIQDGTPIIDTDLTVLRRAGAEVLKEMSLDDYHKIEHHAVEIAIKNNKPIITLKDSTAVKRRDILNRLNEIDQIAGAGRAIRKITVDFGNIATILHNDNQALSEFNPDDEDLKKITVLETEAVHLREQLRLLGN